MLLSNAACFGAKQPLPRASISLYLWLDLQRRFSPPRCLPARTTTCGYLRFTTATAVRTHALSRTCLPFCTVVHLGTGPARTCTHHAFAILHRLPVSSCAPPPPFYLPPPPLPPPFHGFVLPTTFCVWEHFTLRFAAHRLDCRTAALHRAFATLHCTVLPFLLHCATLPAFCCRFTCHYLLYTTAHHALRFYCCATVHRLMPLHTWFCYARFRA